MTAYSTLAATASAKVASCDSHSVSTQRSPSGRVKSLHKGRSLITKSSGDWSATNVRLKILGIPIPVAGERAAFDAPEDWASLNDVVS